MPPRNEAEEERGHPTHAEPTMPPRNEAQEERGHPTHAEPTMPPWHEAQAQRAGSSFHRKLLTYLPMSCAISRLAPDGGPGPKSGPKA